MRVIEEPINSIHVQWHLACWRGRREKGGCGPNGDGRWGGSALGGCLTSQCEWYTIHGFKTVHHTHKHVWNLSGIKDRRWTFHAVFRTPYVLVLGFLEIKIKFQVGRRVVNINLVIMLGQVKVLKIYVSHEKQTGHKPKHLLDVGPNHLPFQWSKQRIGSYCLDLWSPDNRSRTPSKVDSVWRAWWQTPVAPGLNHPNSHLTLLDTPVKKTQSQNLAELTCVYRQDKQNTPRHWSCWHHWILTGDNVCQVFGHQDKLGWGQGLFYLRGLNRDKVDEKMMTLSS